MGVIKQKFSLLAPTQASKRLFSEVGETLQENGLMGEQAQTLCERIVFLAYEKMGKEYTVMGGYPPIEQLLDKSRELMHQLDEAGELEVMASSLEPSKSAVNFSEPSEPSEPELEDAYIVAESIPFVGSEKQVKWARDIAINNDRSIAQSGCQFPSCLPALNGGSKIAMISIAH